MSQSYKNKGEMDMKIETKKEVVLTLTNKEILVLKDVISNAVDNYLDEDKEFLEELQVELDF